MNNEGDFYLALTGVILFVLFSAAGCVTVILYMLLRKGK